MRIWMKMKGSDPFILLLIAVSKRKEYQPYGWTDPLD